MTDDDGDTRAKVENLREQATRCRRLAGHTTDREVARKLLELAQEFERRAYELEDRKGHI